jgi:glycerophosphoryl diester phosphodiesterase
MTQSLARRDTPLVVAHRGASAYAPEHTIAAYELALSQGADLIEVDLHLSADDQPVAIHDATLDRTTDGAGPVRERTLKELKRLDAGGWFGPAFRGHRLQTFQEILERFRGRTGFAVELKGGSDLYPGIEERVVSLLQIYGVVEASLVLSFDYPALAKVREMEPGVQIGALIRESAAPLGVAPGVATALWFAVRLLSEEVVNRTKAAGLDLYAWVVNDAPTIDRLIEWGIRGIVTDNADLVRSRLPR